MAENVIVEKSDRIARVRLNRPDALNAVDVPTRQQLADTFRQLAQDSDIAVVTLTGSGKAFCAGADLKSAAASPDQGVRRTARTLLHDFQPLLECIIRMDKPVIAAVNGPAAGIGMSLALACDLVVMAKGSYLKSPFVDLGLIPDGGAAWFLARRVGYSRALEVLVECQKVSAERCLEWGIANRVVAPDELEPVVERWAAEWADKPPIALAFTKRITRLAFALGLSEVMTVEAELQTVCAASQDCQEAIAAFAEKRAPRFQGR